MTRRLVPWVLAWWAVALAHAGTATRSFSPADYAPLEEVAVAVTLAPLANETFNTLEEALPDGWTLVSDAGGTWDANARRLRWVVVGGLLRTFTYVVRAPASGDATAAFSGVATFDGAVVDVGGALALPRRAPGTAARSFGGGVTTYRPGVPVAVSVVVTPASGTAAYGAEELLPAGWTATGVSDGGSFVGGKVTWPLFVDGLARVLGYTAEAPAGATGPASFSGTATLDGRRVALGGTASLDRGVDVAGTVVRSMPAVFRTGEALAVALAATPDASVAGFSVVEDLPAGWTARSAGMAGTISMGGRRVTWGPFLDATFRVLSYEAVPDAGTRGTGVFAGQGDFAGTVVATTGVAGTTWQPLEDGTVTRALPASCRVGTGFEVTLVASPNEHVSLYSVTEVVPDGYSVTIPAGTTGAPAGSYVAATRTITWGPLPNEGVAATLRYQLTASPAAPSSGVFAGTAVWGEVERATTGPGGLVVLPAVLGTATRTLPGMVEPGASVTVRVVVTPDPGMGLWVVDEVLPEGWTAGSLPAGGSYDAALRRVRLGPFNDDAGRTFEYVATAGLGSSGAQSFSGTATFDGIAVAVAGDGAVVANARPTLTPMADQVTSEDGQAVVSFMALDDLTGPGALVLTASSSNPVLVPPAGLALGLGTGGARTLAMGLAPHQSGTSTITVEVSDGTYTTTRSFPLTVVAVNDAPSFAKGADQVAWDDAGEVTVAGWATGITAGPADESGQGLAFLVEVSDPGLFVIPPAIAADGTLTYTPKARGSGTAVVTVRLQDDGGTASGGVDTSVAQTFTVAVQVRPRVVGRWLFYNGSRFDGNSAALGAADDAAVASNKSALRAGVASTFANVSSYSKGINGVMVDVVGLAGTPTAADFGFRVGRAMPLTGWVEGPAPTLVAVRAGAGVEGSDRVTLRWADSAIRNQWLEVTVKAGGQVGLEAADVFYFGNVVGETGNDLMVTITDVAQMRAQLRFGLMPVTWQYDVNRDGLVNTTDVLLVRLNRTVDLTKRVQALDLTGMGP